MLTDVLKGSDSETENPVDSEEPALLWLANENASMYTADPGLGNTINATKSDSIEYVSPKAAHQEGQERVHSEPPESTSETSKTKFKSLDNASPISETLKSRDNNSEVNKGTTPNLNGDPNSSIREETSLQTQSMSKEITEGPNHLYENKTPIVICDTEDKDKNNGESIISDLNKEIKADNKEDGEATDEVEEDDDEDEDPPILKYSRLSQVPSNLFKNDPVSASTFYETVFIFGTHSGTIHICKPDFTTIRTFKAHRASILSLYTDGTYFASGSMDGTIVIGSISDARDIVMFDYKRPIHAVVLDRNYQRSRSFMCGGMSGKVIYSSKNWLDQRVDVTLDENHGPVISINTIDDLVFWMNDLGITVYHVTSRQVIAIIEKPADAFRSDLYWPKVSFPETDRILIAWGNYIWSLRSSVKSPLGNTGAGSSVKSRLLPSAASLSFRTSVQEKSVHVEHMYKLDYLVSGIASYDGDQWIVLAYNPPVEDEKSGRLEPQNPDLKLIRAQDGAVTHEEEIGFDSAESLGLNDYSLGYHIGPSDSRYFIISARSGVIAQKIQLDDRLQWYLDRHKYYHAWSMSKHLVKPLDNLKFGIRHLGFLVEQDDWDGAAAWMSELLFLDPKEFPVGDTKSTLGTRVSGALQLEEKEAYVKEIGSQWDQWCEIFIKSGHEKELTQIIPKDSRWSLHKSHYTKILQYWLANIDSSDIAYELLKEWDSDLYEVDGVTGTIELILELQSNLTRLRRSLCDIYENNFEPAKVVPHMCIMRDPNIIQFLDQNHILPSFISSIPKFIKYRFKKDTDLELLPVNQVRNILKEVTTILVQRRFEIQPETVVKLMTENYMDILSYLYLEELASIDELLARDFEDTRIKFYCQFDRPKLLPFLMNNQHYNIAKAIEICELSAMVDELVYLLGKTGENKKALELIMEQLNDPERAIKFAKAQTDLETWNTLLEYSFSRPAYIKALIELSDDQSSKFYNPITILQRMSTELNIEGLKESITRVALDNDLNVILNQLVLRIVYKKSEELSKKLNSDMLVGFQFSADSEDLRKVADLFETYVLTLSGKNLPPTIGLVSGVVARDEFAYRLSTDLMSKLKHIQSLQENLRAKIEA